MRKARDLNTTKEDEWMVGESFEFNAYFTQYKVFIYDDIRTYLTQIVVVVVDLVI